MQHGPNFLWPFAPRLDWWWLYLSVAVSLALVYDQLALPSPRSLRTLVDDFWWLNVPLLAIAGLVCLNISIRRLVYFFSKPSFREGPPLWCNVCESLVIGIRSYVVNCDICGITAHGPCALRHMRASTKQKCACKLAAIPATCDDATLASYNAHVWVKGNIDPLDTCDLCGLFCGNILALSAMQCIWCHRRVHESCFEASGVGQGACDYGPHRQLVLPPTSIRINSSSQPPIPSTNALSTVKNAVKHIKITSLRKRTNSITLVTEYATAQIYDLSLQGPEAALAQYCNVPGLRILVCGGDGSVGWVCIGVDAQVALEFHEKRERSPSLFVNQFINKLWYSRAGGSVLWHEDSSDEYTHTPSNGAAKPTLGPASIHDGLLDIVAVYGTLHLGQLQVGLSKALRLRQAKKVQVRLKERLPLQIDGEPWMQDPCAFMLAKTTHERDTVTRQVGEVLDWAGNANVITWEQRDVLLAEITRRVHAKDQQHCAIVRRHFAT
ncbi:hypothetical protein DYB25_004832 [Aphanomyces astaci]|uniref:Phorbol-ester/DAG-type domain-containing protein n=1 Tax=Aphanomyces astaci TaxID=112090 RepID=A0A397ASP0_APHAT|nr:hypothetical protein DYB25_004832 [Aphanomyces astaci]RHY60580.1 hypothetical protein DYB30_006127 [Aphanomyces astaci]